MMPPSIKPPIFGGSFEVFLHYVREPENDSTIISPMKFGQALRVDMQTLAKRSQVHPDTLRHHPETESIQKYIRNNVKVLMATSAINDNVENAIFWFKNYPLSIFDYKTAEELVLEERSEDVLRYIQSLRAGFAG